ncbi:MAG: hypothetical protein ACLQVY_13615 [Limisphaerales bacterium]
MKKVLVAQGEDLGRHFLPVFGVPKIMDETQVALKKLGIEQAQQRRDHSGVEIQAFGERPMLKLGRGAAEAFTETRSQIAT